MFARHCDARGVNDVSLNTACPQPTRQPEAITSGLISDNDALDLAPGLTGFAWIVSRRTLVNWQKATGRKTSVIFGGY